MRRLHHLNDPAIEALYYEVETSIKCRPEAILKLPETVGRWRKRDVEGLMGRYLSPDYFGSVADNIAGRLLSCKIESDGSSYWVGLCTDEGGSPFLGPLGPDIYSGSLGISLFLATHGKVRNCQVSKNGSLNAIQPLTQLLSSEHGVSYLNSIGYGATGGIASVLYGLLRVGDATSSSTLYELANYVVSTIEFDRITKGTSIDVGSGMSGLVLALAAMFQSTEDPFLLELIHRIGSEISKELRSENLHSPDAISRSGLMSPGFAHGLSGVSYALAVVYRLTNDKQLEVDFKKCIALESKWFSDVAGGWPDLRRSEGSRLRGGPPRWCHGSGGVGMSRLGVLDLGYGNDTVELDILRSVNSVFSSEVLSDDGLCCGNFGNLEFLASLSEKVPRMLTSADWQNRTYEAFKRIEETTGCNWPVGRDELNLGLFNGLSGVGYFALRRINPLGVPNVLLFQ